MHKGSCLCGAVSFEVQGELEPAYACHCSQCRKQTGHFLASTEVPRARLTLHGEDKIAWYHASEKARRGFCARCGSVLFWDPIGRDSTWIAMGAFEKPTGIRFGRHVFVADKGDYYDIADCVPQFESHG